MDGDQRRRARHMIYGDRSYDGLIRKIIITRYIIIVDNKSYTKVVITITVSYYSICALILSNFRSLIPNP